MLYVVFRTIFKRWQTFNPMKDLLIDHRPVSAIDGSGNPTGDNYLTIVIIVSQKRLL